MPHSPKCRICFLPFDDVHKPYLLPTCGHTFCSICLRKLLAQSSTACPYCRKPNAVKRLEELPVNYDMLATDYPSSDEDDNSLPKMAAEALQYTAPNSSSDLESQAHASVQLYSNSSNNYPVSIANTSGNSGLTLRADRINNGHPHHRSPVSRHQVEPNFQRDLNISSNPPSIPIPQESGPASPPSQYDEDLYLARQLQEEIDFNMAVHTTFCKDPTHKHDELDLRNSTWNYPNDCDMQFALNMSKR